MDFDIGGGGFDLGDMDVDSHMPAPASVAAAASPAAAPQAVPEPADKVRLRPPRGHVTLCAEGASVTFSAGRSAGKCVFCAGRTRRRLGG